MDTASAVAAVTLPTQASPKKNKSAHNSPKKKDTYNSPRITTPVQNVTNTEQTNLAQTNSIRQEQGDQKRSILVARRRQPFTNVQPADSTTGLSSQSDTSNVKNKTQNPVLSTKIEPQAQSSEEKQISPDIDNPNYEPRIVETFKEFQRAKGSHRLNLGSPKRGNRGNQVSNSNSGSPGGRSHGGRRQRFRELEENDDPDIDRKVLVSGFPSYTQAQDLARVLSEAGRAAVLRCRNRLAVVIFDSEAEARAAVRASDDLCIYGEFLQIFPYTNARHVDDLFRSFKRVISKQKGLDIIEPTKIDLTGDFSQQFNNIQNAVRLTKEEVTAITQLYVDLENALKTVWPGCRAVPFGSIPTGLGIKSSDADCYVEGAGSGRGGGGAGSFVARARRALAQQPRLFAALVAIPRANTPIVKFLHVPSNRHCDVSAKTPLGAQNSKLIKLVLDGDPRLAPLAVALKYWGKVHELTGTGRLTNYALVTMLVFYLQRAGLAPAVQRLQPPAAALLVDHWNAGFEPDPDFVPSNPAPMADLLGGFFRYYATFDFAGSVVCPLLGAPVPKLAFATPEALPPQMERYVRNVRQQLASPLRHATPFCVQDPFELSHNVASSVTHKHARDIRAFLEFAAQAYDRDRAAGCPGLLRTILLAKPELERRDGATPTTKIFLIPRIRGEFVDPDWRARVRDVLLDQIFATILKIELERDDEPEEKPAEAGVRPQGALHRERYKGAASKPVWRRKHYWIHGERDRSLVAKNEQITIQILQNSIDAPLQFHLELGFRDDPTRSCYVLAKLVDGDLDAFRGFVKFIHSFMFDWFRALLSPFLRVEDKNKPAAAERPAAVAAGAPPRPEPDVARLLAAVSLAGSDQHPPTL